MKAAEQADAGEDEHGAQGKSAQNSPDQDPLLVLFGDAEIAEDEKENEEVIDAEREFDDIAGDELECRLLALPVVQESSERQSQGDPDGAADRSFSKRNSFFAPAEDAEVERQHEQDEGVEGDPKQRAQGHGDSWPATTCAR